ncbi:hypothetical protein ACIBBG_32730 [Micromonospora chersina]|uniref:hypothetical protein n=1 Tax=Micromonospora chersina TaxID=47854 RepID=UPI00378B2366
MSETKWHTLRYDNSGPNCPQFMVEGDMVYLRDSATPMDIAVFPTASWETLKQKIRDGEI